LELLSRPEELRAAGSWSYSARTIGPPRPIRLDDASLADVIDGFFQPLRPRERRMVDMRFGSLQLGGATLAEIGAEFGLTRERVRQILQVSLQRLAADTEQQRRRHLAQFVAETVEGAGGLMRETDLAAALRARLQPPHPECGPFLRAFLASEPEYRSLGHGVWAIATVSLEAVAELRVHLRTAVRDAGRPLHRAELLAAGRNGGAHGEAFILSCLRTDDRLCSRDGERYGLVEWEWLVPRTLVDYVYLALRSAGRPRHYLWITEYVNSLVPEGQEVSARDIHATLLDRSDWFARVREGTYGLTEVALFRRAERVESEERHPAAPARVPAGAAPKVVSRGALVPREAPVAPRRVPGCALAPRDGS
jgi:hypothetical protein